MIWIKAFGFVNHDLGGNLGTSAEFYSKMLFKLLDYIIKKSYNYLKIFLSVLSYNAFLSILDAPVVVNRLFLFSVSHLSSFNNDIENMFVVNVNLIYPAISNFVTLMVYFLKLVWVRHISVRSFWVTNFRFLVYLVLAWNQLESQKLLSTEVTEGKQQNTDESDVLW